jgi:hypothetical protein
MCSIEDLHRQMNILTGNQDVKLPEPSHFQILVKQNLIYNYNIDCLISELKRNSQFVKTPEILEFTIDKPEFPPDLLPTDLLTIVEDNQPDQFKVTINVGQFFRDLSIQIGRHDQTRYIININHSTNMNLNTKISFLSMQRYPISESEANFNADFGQNALAPATSFEAAYKHLICGNQILDWVINESTHKIAQMASSTNPSLPVQNARI